MVPKTCSIPECEKPSRKRTWCNSHYKRMQKYGDPLGVPKVPTRSERFWAKVDKSGSCWIWTACRNIKGYGRTDSDKGVVLAHRQSYEWAYGPIPDGLLVDHRCHNPACVNPAHLRTVTPKQNLENRYGANRGNPSGVLGVSWHEASQAWEARVGHRGRTYRAGRFATVAQAEAAVVAKRNELFTHNDRDRKVS